MPPQFQVTKGEEPKNVDEEVRFRTTYYFRVQDICVDQPAPASDSENIFPKKRVPNARTLKDSIYRFRMTGKASEIFSQVHFESGTLKSYQIDPFGANVAFDESNGRFYYKSQQETQDDAHDAAALERFQKYRKLLGEHEGDKDPFNAEIVALALGELHSVGGQARLPVEATLKIASAQVIGSAREAAIQAEKASGLARQAVAGGEVPGEKSKAALDELVRTIEAKAPDVIEGPDTLIRNTKSILDLAVQLADESVKEALNAKETAQRKVKPATLVDAGVLARNGRKAKGAKTGNAPEQTQTKPDAGKKANEALDATQLQWVSATDYASQARQQRRTWDALVLVARNAAANLPSALGTDPGEECPRGAKRRRGFQILGPEGLRTFDQDERLVMAMSSDGKPLIGLLQDLSGRVLSQKTNPAEQAIPLMRERLKLSEAFRALDQQARGPGAKQDEALPSSTAEGVVKAVIEAFDRMKEGN